MEDYSGIARVSLWATLGYLIGYPSGIIVSTIADAITEIFSGIFVGIIASILAGISVSNHCMYHRGKIWILLLVLLRLY